MLRFDRRTFFRTLGGGIVVLLCPGLGDGQERQSGRPERPEELPQEISAWLHVGADGRVTVYTGKVEMGQNIRTSLSQQVAEELRVPIGAVALVMGDTGLVPWDAGTFGSRTTPEMGPRLRSAAAAARRVLVGLAATRWAADPALLVAHGGAVEEPRTGRRLTYGELSEGKALLEVIGEPRLAPPERWAVAGTRVAKVEGAAFVTGAHRYVSDWARPQLWHGKVLRPPAFRASLSSLEVPEQQGDVRVVREGDFVGVAAPTPWAAEAALKGLRAQWSAPPQPGQAELFARLEEDLDEAQPGFHESVGDAAGALSSAEVRLEGRYTVHFIAHVPLEPRAAVAEWSADGLTVWTATQRPFSVRDELAAAFGLPPGEVRVLVPDSGAAYGGKHTGETALEASRLARGVGRPVKVVWSREEEFTWAYFRPAGVIEVRSGAARDGALGAWEFHNYNSGPAGIRTPYAIPHQEIRYHPARPPLRQGSYRALAATANHFARETHMDELAHALGLDPLAFRLRNLQDPRLRAVFQAAAERAGWAGRRASGRALGLAGGLEKGGYVATCAEVEVGAGGQVRVRRIVEAFDCGPVVNPDGLRNQIEGAIVQGLGGALFEAVRFEGGRILNPRFSEYRVPRFRDLPAIEVVLLDRKGERPAGAGETPIVGVAPAVGNALFAATGVRLRGLPLVPEGLPRESPPGTR